MKLREKVSKDYMIAFKERNTIKKTLLSVIKGEIQSAERSVSSTHELSDEEVLKILNKTAKSLRETLSHGDESAQLELDIVETYLPKLMSREEVTNKVKEIIESGATNIGMIMKEFSSLPVDKKMVSEVARELM